MVKTDGQRIVVLSEGILIVADVSGPEPEVVGRLHLGSGTTVEVGRGRR